MVAIAAFFGDKQAQINFCVGKDNHFTLLCCKEKHFSEAEGIFVNFVTP